MQYSGNVPASVDALLALTAIPGTVFLNDATVEQYRNRQASLTEQQAAIVAAAEEAGREMTVEERAQFDGMAAEFERLTGEINRRQTLLAQQGTLTAPVARRAAPDQVEGQDDSRPVANAQPAAPLLRPANSAARVVTVSANGNGGFHNIGDFARAVVRAANSKNTDMDRRLQNAAASSIGQESVGADGGFAIPPDFAAAIYARVFGEDSLVSRADLQTSSGNTWTSPVDETTPWGSTGIRAYWESEAAAITQSKPNLRQNSVRLHKLAALVPITEEMLEDAPAIDGYLRSKAPEAIDWSISFAMVWGTGVGQPLGVMNSGALVTQAAEGSQTADTINAANISKMYTRMPVRNRRNAVWLIHPDAEQQLFQMTLGQMPVYLPPGGLSQSPFGQLMGRPVIPHQACETVGDLGDIIFADFSSYLAVRKAGGIKATQSMHLWFDQDIMAFKFTMRMAGQPWFSAPLSMRDGSNTQSGFVTLAAR